MLTLGFVPLIGLPYRPDAPLDYERIVDHAENNTKTDLSCLALVMGAYRNDLSVRSRRLGFDALKDNRVAFMGRALAYPNPPAI